MVASYKSCTDQNKVKVTYFIQVEQQAGESIFALVRPIGTCTHVRTLARVCTNWGVGGMLSVYSYRNPSNAPENVWPPRSKSARSRVSAALFKSGP